MDKLIYTDECEGLMEAVLKDRPMTLMIDDGGGITKSASSLISRDIIDQYRPTDKNKFGVHLIAMGDSEMYGFNKNGDWFGNDTLIKRAHTFVDYGNVFREHANKDFETQGIGLVKYAAYGSAGMHRVELVVEMDRDKAPKEYEMAKQGKDLSWSMSCRVPYDVCSCCGHASRTMSGYCDCLKYNMTRYMPKSAKYAYAENVDPTFFDISVVGTPADRIARRIEYLFPNDSTERVKAASAGGVVMSGAMAAQMEGVNFDRTLTIGEMDLLYKLASEEEYIKGLNPNDIYTSKRASFSQSVAPFSLLEPIDARMTEAMRALSPGALLNVLAKRACVLSFPAFASWITGDPNAIETPEVKKACAIMLPDIFSSMLHGDRSSEAMDMFRPCCDTTASDESGLESFTQKFMDMIEEKFSIQAQPVRHRITIVLSKEASANKLAEQFTKAASAPADDVLAHSLATAYGHYQISALCAIKQACGSNAVEQPELAMIAGSNSVRVLDR